MRRRILTATLAIVAGIVAACSDNPTQPIVNASSASMLSINVDGCVDKRIHLAEVNPIVQGLITNLFADQNQRSSTASMWENIKKDKLDGKPIQNHIDNLTKWTLDHLSAKTLSDPDGPTGLLNATTGSVRLLDLVFRCAGEVPTQVPNPPAGFDAIFKLVDPSATVDQQINTSFNDAAAFVPKGSLDVSTLVVLVRQPEEVNVNTPFPKVSRTVDVALAGGRVVGGNHLSVIFCPFETIDHDRNVRLVVAHQKTAVATGAPVGQGVEYLAPPEGGHLDCPHGIAEGPQQERNVFMRGLLAVAGKALSVISPKSLYAGHAGIGGMLAFVDDETGGLSPMVLVDPYVETGIVVGAIPTTTYGQPVAFSAQLRVTNVPATCDVAGAPAVCSWKNQPVTQSLAGMPTLTLSALEVTATLDGQNLTHPIDADGNVQFSFTHINAGDDQTASLDFPPKINMPANAPHFGHSTASSLYTVNRRALTATATANEWEYGTVEPVTGSFNSTEVQYGENVTATFTTTQDAMSEVDVYDDALVADVLFGSGVRAANYLVTKTNADLTIVKAPLVITANSKSRFYGAANPGFDAVVTGIKNGDAHTLAFTTPAVATSVVSPPTYAITPSVTGPRIVRNYNVTLNDGALTINPAPLSVVIHNETRQYGDANPAFSTNPFTTLNSDVLTVAFTTTPAADLLSGIGNYTIGGTVSGPRVNNYAVTVTPGTLSITKRNISITVDNATRSQGVANSAFTGIIGGGGLVATDGVTADYTSPAVTSSPAGSYAINAALLGANSANYNASITPGTLTVIATSPQIVSLTLSSSNVSIANSGGFTALLSNPDPASGNWVLQGYLVQGANTQAAGGVVTICGAGNGVLPTGNCTQSFSISASGAGLIAGAATYRLELVHNGVLVDSKTAAVTLIP